MDGPYKILWIEDDRRFAAVWSRELEEAGFKVVVVNSVDGIEAALNEGPYSAIIYDWVLSPGILFANEDSEGGLKTGEFLREWLIARVGSKVLQVVYTASPELCPEATNVCSKMSMRPRELGERLLTLVTAQAAA